MTAHAGPAAAGHRGRQEIWRGRVVAVSLGLAFLLPLALDSSGDGPLAFWIWASFWAPACGVLAASYRSSRLLLIPILVCGAPLALGVINAPRPQAGALALLGLYLLGAASNRASCNAFALAGCWLLGAGVLAALPSAGGTWLTAPGATWLVRTLDLSPQVWVCELAGFDWMRHSSVYEVAGAGDLGPHERLAWSGLLWPALLSAASAALLVLSTIRWPRSSTSFD